MKHGSQGTSNQSWRLKEKEMRKPEVIFSDGMNLNRPHPLKRGWYIQEGRSIFGQNWMGEPHPYDSEEDARQSLSEHLAQYGSLRRKK
jgi:hypothetical protein